MSALSLHLNKPAVPAKAGTHQATDRAAEGWAPAFAGAAVFLLTSLPALPAPAAEAPAGASSCSGCHAASAAVQTPVPRLVGVPAPQIVTAMQAFRTGQRPATVMDRIAKGFAEDEVAAIAAWYAAQKE